MKKTGLVMASIMGAVLLLGIFGYSLVAAQEDNGVAEHGQDRNPKPHTEDETQEHDAENETQETENETEENETEEDEVHIGPGAEVRLNQLQKHLEKAIARENNAISAVQTNAPNASVSDLQQTVNSTQTVLDNVSTAITNLPNTTNQDAVNLFVSLKHQAADLFYQFRQQFKSLLDTLTSQQREQIKQQLHPLEASSD